jgi:hypothetical protein
MFDFIRPTQSAGTITAIQLKVSDFYSQSRNLALLKTPSGVYFFLPIPASTILVSLQAKVSTHPLIGDFFLPKPANI